MFFRSPFFRFIGHDLEHMMTRNMLRNEMMMRNEFLRAMDAFEAFEQQAIERSNHHRHHRNHHQRHLRGQERENQAPTQQPKQPKEAENTANKAKQSETNNMKVKETETRVKEPERRVNENHRELRSQPQRRDAFSEWNNSIDEFFRDASPFGYRSSFFDDFYPSRRFDSFGRYENEMRAEMDRHFKTLENPEAKEEYPTLAENTSYFMRVETNDNGHVKVKTVKKNPGSVWETKFEEYKKEKSNNTAAVEKDSAQSKQSIETKESVKENLETSQKKEEAPAKLAEGSQKSSESATPASA